MPDFWRQLDIISPREMEKTEVTIIGAGGIGSPAAITLSKMGIPKLKLMDDDTDTPYNLPSTFFRLTDPGKMKIDALSEIVALFSGTKVESVPEKFD